MRSGRSSLALALLLAFLAFGVLFPVATLLHRSITDSAGANVGLANYSAYFNTPGLATSLYHTLNVGVVVSLAVTALAFVLAFCFTHARVWGGGVCRYLSLLPLYVPSIFFPIGMIYLFGRHGLVGNALGIRNIYGWGGIVFGEIVFTLPHATLLLITAMRGVDKHLYMAARTLGASPWRRFVTITVPQTRVGLVRAFLVSFILVITDFGIPKVLGGDYMMLSTELYMQIIGLQDLSMGSAIGMVMLAPTLLAFAIDLWVTSRDPVQAGAAGYQPPEAKRLRDLAATLIAWGVVLAPFVVIATAVGGSFVAFWPYDLTLTFASYNFENSVYGIKPFYNSLAMAAAASVIGTILAFAGAYLVVRTSANRVVSLAYRGLVFLSLGIPGTVLGLSFVFAFNRRNELFQYLYGSWTFLVFYCIIHFFAMAHLVSAGGLSSLDRRYEAVGKTLGVGRLSTLFRVVLPLRLSVAFDIAFYFFINAMTTVSGMVFIFSSDSVPAAVSMLHFTDTGYYPEAAAMGTLILASTLAARALYAVPALWKRLRARA